MSLRKQFVNITGQISLNPIGQQACLKQTLNFTLLQIGSPRTEKPCNDLVHAKLCWADQAELAGLLPLLSRAVPAVQSSALERSPAGLAECC